MDGKRRGSALSLLLSHGCLFPVMSCRPPARLPGQNLSHAPPAQGHLVTQPHNCLTSLRPAKCDKTLNKLSRHKPTDSWYILNHLYIPAPRAQGEEGPAGVVLASPHPHPPEPGRLDHSDAHILFKLSLLDEKCGSGSTSSVAPHQYSAKNIILFAFKL